MIARYPDWTTARQAAIQHLEYVLGSRLYAGSEEQQAQQDAMPTCDFVSKVRAGNDQHEAELREWLEVQLATLLEYDHYDEYRRVLLDRQPELEADMRMWETA